MSRRKCPNGGEAWPFHGGPVTAEDLAPIPVAIKREFAEELNALVALVDEGLVVMTHEPDWCDCDGTRRLTAACVRATTGAPQFNGQQIR